MLKKSNKIFNRLSSHRFMLESELKYFTFIFKKATNLGKFYFLSKIYKRLVNVPVSPVISNCGTPTETLSGTWIFCLSL